MMFVVLTYHSRTIPLAWGERKEAVNASDYAAITPDYGALLSVRNNWVATIILLPHRSKAGSGRTTAITEAGLSPACLSKIEICTC